MVLRWLLPLLLVGPPGACGNPGKESGYSDARPAQLLVPERQLGKPSVGPVLKQPC